MSSASEGGSVECTHSNCSRTFDNERGMAAHHARVHGKREANLVCERCGGDYTRPPSAAEESRFCSRNCQTDWQADNRGEGPQHEGDPSHECPVCGDKFHSEDGMRTHRGMKHGRITTECHYCEGDVEVTQFELESREKHYCSGECSRAHLSEIRSGNKSVRWTPRIETECTYCDRAEEVRPTEISEEGRWFCDQECYGDWRSDTFVGPRNVRWEGGPFPYGRAWNESKKELVRERDGRRCRICGRSGREHSEQHNRKLTVHHIVRARDLQDAPAEIRNAPFNLVTICCSHNNLTLEAVPSWIQFMAFLPHPPLPTE